MTGIMNIQRCGTCHFAKLIPHDLSKRVCWGAPPHATQVPAGPGRMTLQMIRPIVGVSEEACALYRNKQEADVVRDTETMRELQETDEVMVVKTEQ